MNINLRNTGLISMSLVKILLLTVSLSALNVLMHRVDKMKTGTKKQAMKTADTMKKKRR